MINHSIRNKPYNKKIPYGDDFNGDTVCRTRINTQVSMKIQINAAIDLFVIKSFQCISKAG